MFYKTGVDIASVKSMWNFLHDHFTYSTLNSWNGMKSIANKVKLYNLKLDGDWTVALRYLEDEADSGGLQMLIADEIQNFESTHPNYRVGFNGRSNGYLVLYNVNSYMSVLPDCLDYDNYEDFKEEVKSWRSAVSDYKDELRQCTELVRDFDLLCDTLRELVNEYTTRDFDAVALESAVECFNSLYGHELQELGVELPEFNNDTIPAILLKSAGKYDIFIEALKRCLTPMERPRIHIEDNILSLA